MVQIIVLAAVAFFLFWRLKSVLGSRQGFENPKQNRNNKSNPANQNSKSKKNEDIIDLKPNAIDEDVADYVEEDSEQFKTLNNLKTVEKGWMVSHFVSGAKLAYEEILMAFETGDLEKIKKMTSNEVYLTFKDVIDDRNAKSTFTTVTNMRRNYT